LTIKRVKGGTRLSYNARAWRSVCKHLDLDSPVLCLLERSDSDGAEDVNGVIGHR